MICVRFFGEQSCSQVDQREIRRFTAETERIDAAEQMKKGNACRGKVFGGRNRPKRREFKDEIRTVMQRHSGPAEFIQNGGHAPLRKISA